MEWQSSWTDPFQNYLKPFASLIGDGRTWRVLLETVWRDHREWQCDWAAHCLILPGTEPE